MSKHRPWIVPAFVFLTVLGLALAPYLAGPVTAQGGPDLERGRYMVLTGHCNNCHTSGYTKAEGNLPEKQWLMGSGALGYRGPWGTTYSSNLRLTVQTFTEDDWVKYAKGLKSKPPMPWWSLRDTSEQDLRAMYKYIKLLGPAGEPAKAWVPPDKDPDKPYELRQLIQ